MANLTPSDRLMLAEGRRPDCTYIAKSFVLNQPGSRDHGRPARFVSKVFLEPAEVSVVPGEPVPEAQVLSRRGRVQVELMVAGEPGAVRALVIQRVEVADDGSRALKDAIKFDRAGAGKLLDLVQALRLVPLEGESGVRVDDDLLRTLFTDPGSLQQLYGRDPERFRRLVEDDASTRDLIALAHQREQLEHFSRLLHDPAFFAEQQAGSGRGPESVWQAFLEANPWILGVSLAGQLMTAYDPDKLEQVVVGPSVATSGKRVDALLATEGGIRNLVFAEIKHHQTDLLQHVKIPYRAACWAPSAELAGGVVQIQQTVDQALQYLSTGLPEKDEAGAETGERTFAVRPRCYLIAGRQDELRGPSGGVHRDKHRSFELFRRNLYEPQIITFDELHARASWQVAAVDAARGATTTAPTRT